MFPQANLSAYYGNLTQQKHAFTDQNQSQNKSQNKQEKQKPGLGAFYDIRLGNWKMERV